MVLSEERTSYPKSAKTKERCYAQSASGYIRTETEYRQGHRRQGRGDRAAIDRADVQGSRASGGRARHRQDHHGQRAGQVAGLQLQPHPVYAGRGALRCDGLHHGELQDRGDGVSSRGHHVSDRAGRRNQPYFPQDTERPSGGHGGISGHGGRRDPSLAQALYGAGHPEPHGVRGHLSPARGPDGPFLHPGLHGLSHP